MSSLKVKHFKRYKDFAWLLLKYGQLDMLKEMDPELGEKTTLSFPTKTPSPEELVKDLQSLGPTFIKLGQLLSTQTDFLPDAYAEALSKLQDQVDPFSYEEVEKIFQEELGLKVRDIFQEFDTRPIAAASLSQVHRAVLPSQRVVAVKIQRPHIQKEIIEDLEVLNEIAHFLENQTEWGKRYRIVDKIAQLHATLLNEIDFKKEALNLISFRENLKEFKNIIIPSPIQEYSTTRILTMDFLEGQKITKMSPLIRMEIDGEKLAQELFEAYLKQILIDGLVHVDPHPGNVYLSQDNQIILLDVGMVAHIGSRMQMGLLKLLIAISEGQGDEVADILIRLGEKTKGFIYSHFREQISTLIGEYHDLNWSQLPLGKLFLKIARLSANTGVVLPPNFNLLGKALLNLDLAGKLVAPNFKPNEAIRQKASELLSERLKKNFSLNLLSHILIDGAEFLQQLPNKLRDFLDILSSNSLKVKVETIDEYYLMRGFEKIANRITLGLILAALIIGASQLMKVQTVFTLWGYPGFAILLFLAAVIGGIVLMINILISDKKEKD